MKHILTLVMVLGCTAVSAQEPQPQYPQQPYFQPVGPTRQAYQMVVPPGAYVYPPPCYCPRPRGYWGVWPIPFPLGVYY